MYAGVRRILGLWGGRSPLTGDFAHGVEFGSDDNGVSGRVSSIAPSAPSVESGVIPIANRPDARLQAADLPRWRRLPSPRAHLTPQWTQAPSDHGAKADAARWRILQQDSRAIFPLRTGPPPYAS